MLSQEISAFIKSHKDLITNKEFTEFYFYASHYLSRNKIHLITEMFLKANINPLNYMKRVPNNYLMGSDMDFIAIPETIESIGEHAFTNMQKLKRVIIPKNVELIEDYAFTNCDNLKTVIIQGNIQKLYDDTFTFCVDLETLYLPKSLKIINIRTNELNLKNIYYEGNSEDFRRIIWDDFPFYEITVYCADKKLKSILGEFVDF